MLKYQRIFTNIGIAAIVFLLIGLLGWYFFLRTQTGDIRDLEAARGFNISVPSFTGSRSSTAENIASGVVTESLLAVTEGQGAPPRLWKVSTSPIAGFGFIGASTTLRYVERATGHIYDVNVETGAATRVTNELIPKVYEAHIVGTTTVVLRLLDDTGMPTTLIGVLGTTTDDGFTRFTTSNLGTTIRTVAPSSVRPEIMMLAEGADNVTHLIRARADGTAPQQVLTLGVGGFALEWLSDGKLFLVELPASGIPGHAYEVVQDALNPILRGVPGLMVTPRPASGALLYSSDDGARVRLFVRPAAGSSITEITLGTIAKKCVWAPASTGTSTPTLTIYCAAPQEAVGANFLDRWLRGVLHTADAWFRIDASAGAVERFFTPETTVALDVERPAMDSAGEYIAFMNARDKSLWLLRVNE
ncbi:MAG TPA: hypothetical protein VNM40_04070 [Candidatus Paceibacterota bacterium]|nr:hypothetical protein [Candidatus Paceibacterota bacterium]